MSDYNKLCGCFAKDGEEIDGEEFGVDTLEEFIELLDKNKDNKQIHLNFYKNNNIDIWLN